MPRYSFENLMIDGFRGLRNLQLKDLGLINVLVGENNSGKTSVLEALSIMCSPLEPLEWLGVVRRRDFGRLDETRIQSLRWCFSQQPGLADPDQKFEGACQLFCEGLFPLRRLRVTYLDIMGEPDLKSRSRRPDRRQSEEVDVDVFEPRRGAEITHYVDSEAPLEPPTLFDGEPITIRVWEDEPAVWGHPRRRRGQIPCDTLTPYSYQINSLQVRLQSRQIYGKRRDMVLSLLRDFDRDVEDIKLASFRGGRPALYLLHRRLGPAPLSIFGDALRRAVLLVSTLLTLGGGGVLLIDEVETGIHVSALKQVFAWLTRAARELGVQIVATTHSLEAVDALALSGRDCLEDLVTFHLEQTENETRGKRIAGELLLRLRQERGLDVR